MPDSAANSDERKRHSAFKRGDVLIFVVLPIVLILGFLLFLWWRPTLADPNLRLVAQVTDDISVELVAVAQYTGQKTPYTKWWKPNGLPAEGIVEANLNFQLPNASQPQRIFLFEVTDKRNKRDVKVQGDIVTGNATTWSPRDDGRFLRVLSYVEPTLWSTCQCGVELASRGTEVVGNLSPETLSCISVVRGVTTDIKLLPSDKIPLPNRNDGHEWTVFIDEPVSQRSDWTIDAYIEGKQLLTGNWSATFEDDRYLNYWSLDSDVCPTVEVRRTLHDFKVRFDGIAAHAGSITSPRVDYVGPVQTK